MSALTHPVTQGKESLHATTQNKTPFFIRHQQVLLFTYLKKGFQYLKLFTKSQLLRQSNIYGMLSFYLTWMFKVVRNSCYFRAKKDFFQTISYQILSRDKVVSRVVHVCGLHSEYHRFCRLLHDNKSIILTFSSLSFVAHLYVNTRSC